ncbi:MAG: HAD-IIA family hydrolase, partial [Marmoricola sp.]
AGVAVAFVTNNSSRTPHADAEHFNALGVEAATTYVVTSAQAAATLLAERLPPGSRVYLMGGEGLEVALDEVGLISTTDPELAVDAVVQGYGPDMPWRRVVGGAILVQRGVPWVAANTDRTIPTPLGIGPGNGALVELVARHSGREPVVAGKPEPPLLREVERRRGSERPLFVGDRLDTDMAGATNVGWPSLLVLTGVTTLADLVAAAPAERPTYLARDLSGLHRAHPRPEPQGSAWVVGGWTARVEDGALVVEGEGAAEDWWRGAAAAAWSYLDDEERNPHHAAALIDDLDPPR